MNNKKSLTSLLVLVTLFWIVGCGSSNNPSDFFTVVTTATVNGLNIIDPNVHVNGQAISPAIYCTQFPNGTSGFDAFTDSNGQYTVQNAALGGNSCSWSVLRDISSNCPQVSVQTIYVTAPGGTFDIQCAVAVNTFVASPARFDPTAPPATITITGHGMYSTYAMPRVTFYNQYQTAMLTVTAVSASPDGTTLVVPTSQVTFSPGGYAAVISVMQADNTWLTVGGAGIRLYTPPDIGGDKCYPPMPCE